MADYRTLCARLAADALGVDIARVTPLLKSPPSLEQGDVALPCFPFAKERKQAPPAVAAEVAAAIEGQLEGTLIERVVTQGPFLNFFVDRAAEAKAVVEAVRAAGSCYGGGDVGGGRHVVVDYSSPNIAKPFHIGHMRSTILGAALINVHQHLGYKTVGINHLGDWGTQFGHLLEAFERWGDEAELEANPIPHLLDLYVRFNEEGKQIEKEIEEGRRPAEDSWFACGRARFAALEAGDEALRARWQRFRDLSLGYFKSVYEQMDVDFDHYKGESDYTDKTGDVIAWIEQLGIGEESEGALIVRVHDDKDKPPAMVRKSDGATNYMTRDLAAIRERIERYQPAKLLYVVGTPQADHFELLFGVLAKAGIPEAAVCHHVGFGHVAGLSTRRGNIVFLEEVFATAIEKVSEIIEEKNPDLPDKAEVARQVGVGAVMFADMRTTRIKDTKFCWDDVVRFTGDTGPYVMFNHARACSILRKFEGEIPASIDGAQLTTQHDTTLIRTLAAFPGVVQRAADELEPSLIARHLLAVSSACSAYVQSDDHRVIDAEEPALRQARAALIDATRQVLSIGLKLLGMATPEAM